jgi:hypothetical protein
LSSLKESFRSSETLSGRPALPSGLPVREGTEESAASTSCRNQGGGRQSSRPEAQFGLSFV